MGEDFVNITFSDSPCWHELSWQEKEPAIILRIHEDFIKSIDFNLQDSMQVKSLKEDLKLPDFSDNFDEDFGFDKVFKHIGKKDGFVEFLVKIPQVKIITGKKCPECGGSGKNKEIDLECHYCNGTGKEEILDWSLIYKISATFSAISPLMSFYRKGSSVFFPQLLTVYTITKKDMHGGSLSGNISNPLKEWLFHHFKDGEEIPEITEAMRVAYGTMLGFDDYNNSQLRFVVRQDGRFSSDCPGDACGLYPDTWDFEEGRGYRFNCHNVDNPIQQLTLITSLAVLHDMVRKGMKSNLTKV
jgi:hypothetical protein